MTQERSAYYYFTDISTRWRDNDIYGHVNNVVYYSYFDSVANQYLIEHAGLNIHIAETVGFVVASNCEYHSPLAYPEALQGGFRVNKMGNKSVEYGLAIFRKGEELAAATGSFTHVFVDRNTGQSTIIPDSIRSALERAIIRT